MARPISGEYRIGRRILTGDADPSGLALAFELDGERVFCHAAGGPGTKGRVTAAGYIHNVIDDLAHASIAALRKRIGVTRECRIRFLKPLYAGESFRADGHVVRDAGELFSISARLVNARDQLCVEGEVEVFALSGERLRRMTPDGMLPLELRRFFPA